MATITLRRLAALLVTAATCTGAGAAGVLCQTKPGNPQPLRWNTSKPIPVCTDLGVFTYAADGVTPFITNQRANDLVAFALNQ